MDFDDLDEPTPKPAVRKFVPKPKGKPLQKKEPSTVVKSESMVKTEPVLKPKPEPMEVVSEDLCKKEVVKDLKIVSSELESGSASGMVQNGDVEDVKTATTDIVEVFDQVVREIDVFFNPRIDENTQMYLMQYPLRPLWRPYDLEHSCKEIRMKPKSAKVEMDIEVDVDSRSHHERLCVVNTITKTLTSPGNILPKAGSDTVGVLKGNKLYLNPVNAVVQLRPSNYSGDDEVEEGEDKHGAKSAEHLNKKQTAALVKKQGNMISPSMQTTNDKESWVPLKYHSTKSEESSNCLRKLMVTNHTPVPVTLSPSDYLNAFCPRKSNNGMRQSVLSMRSLKSLPLEERIKKWLCKGGEPAYRFSVLKYLAFEDSDEDFIEKLKQHAVLVHGLWVPKNSIAMPDCEERDLKYVLRYYLILKFSQELTIREADLVFRKEMRSVLNEVIEMLAVKRTVMKDWKFRVPADPSFAKLYPSVAQQQRQQWKEREPDIMAKISPFIDRPQRTKSFAETPQMSIEKQDALLKALRLLFTSNSVNSLETICSGLRDLAVSAASSRTEDTKWRLTAAGFVNCLDELKGVLNEFATCIHGSYVAKSSLVHPELDPLRKVVIQLFLAAPPNTKLKKANILEAFKIAFKKEVPINDYQKVITELCSSNGSAWMLKNPGGR